MKNAIRNLMMVLALALVAMPALAQRGPGDGGGTTGGPQPPSKSAMYYLTNDSCRLVLEAKMSTEDAAAFEAAVADFKTTDQALRALKPQIEAAMRAHDTAALAALQLQAQALQQQEQTDLGAISQILVKYQADSDLVMRECHPTLPGGEPGDKDTTHKGGRGRGHEGDKGKGPRVRFDAGFFVGHDTCRWALEAKMSAEDAQAFEAAALAIQADDQAMRDLMKQVREALRNRDTAAIAALRLQIQALRDKGQADRKAYMQILTKYADQIGAVRKECWSPRKPDGRRDGKTGGTTEHILDARPIYPNPVRVGEAVTLEYVLSADADVNITLNDAMGTTLQTLATGSEPAGNHSLSISTAGLQSGNFYVRIQARTDVKTQKFAIIQ
jgi:hypothetical protein